MLTDGATVSPRSPLVRYSCAESALLVIRAERFSSLRIDEMQLLADQTAHRLIPLGVAIFDGFGNPTLHVKAGIRASEKNGVIQPCGQIAAASL